MVAFKFTDILSLHNEDVRKTSYDKNLRELIENFDFETLLIEECGEILHRNQKYIAFKNCPICGHKECFCYYLDSKRYRCFGKNGDEGGNIIDYLIKTRNLNKQEAISYFKHDLCKIPKIQNSQVGHSIEQSKFEYISAVELMNKEFAPLHWCIDNFLPQGLAIIAAPPKYGKSWACLQLALSVANGKNFLGYSTKKGKVLYFALEDSHHRLRKRIKKLLGEELLPNNLDISIKANSITTGLIDDMEEYINKNPEVELIIIDTLQKVRTGSTKNEGAYAADYRELSIIKSFADKHSISVLVVHHLRKAKDNDVFNKISGTNAIMGVADTTYVINKENRDSNNATLHITGRDVEFTELNIEFNPASCQWICQGNAEFQAERKRIAEYNNEPVVKLLRKILKKTDDIWSGTALELLKACADNDIKIEEMTPAKLGKKLKKISSYFQDIDQIIYTPPNPNGSNGKRLHKFKKGVEIKDELNLMKDIEELFI